MAINIHKLIAAVSPEVYCDPKVRKEVKKIVKEEMSKGNDKAYLKAAEKAKPINSDYVYSYDDANAKPLEKWGLKAPSEEHEITYDSVSESLEPLYFWTIDFMRNFFSEVEKLTDNFVSSPGSGHFSELGQKLTRMQEEAMKILGTANNVLRSVLNLVYDLKEMKLLLQTYDDLQSDNERIREAARLSLKQRWMDLVDIQKGQGSINALASGNLDFVTLRDAFMVANSLKNADEIDLNDRVKRILKQRVGEFLRWAEESEKQLRTRYKVEVNYLRSQVASLKLYSNWIKPYLKAARKLQANAQGQQEALVTTFNTIILELTIMGKGEYEPEEDVKEGRLPEIFMRTDARKYSRLTFVEFHFRGIPQRVSQRGDWSFAGKTNMKFKSYSLNDQELQVLKDQIERDDLGDVLGLIEGVTEDSLGKLQEDIDEFLKEENKEEKEREKKRRMREEDINPFRALFEPLFSSFKSFKEKKKDDWSIKDPIKPDSLYEEVIRSQAIIAARENCFMLFDIYKRAHKMPAHISPFEPIS